MSESEIITTLEELSQKKEEIVLELSQIVKTFFEEDRGGIDRCFGPALALEAAKNGKFDLAIQHLKSR